MASTNVPASNDPYFIESVPMYYDFSNDHDNTLGDRFFEMSVKEQTQFESSPVCYDRVRTPLAEVNGGENGSMAQQNGEQPRVRRVSKTNMVAEFNKEMQKRRSINTEAPKATHTPTQSNATVQQKAKSNVPAAGSIFKPKTDKNRNPTVIGTIGIKATPNARPAEKDTNSSMRLRPKRSSLFAPKDKQAAGDGAQAEQGSNSSASKAANSTKKETEGSVFKPRCSMVKQSAPRPSPLQRRSFSSAGNVAKQGPQAPKQAAKTASEGRPTRNTAHAKQSVQSKSIFSVQNKPIKKPEATHQMRLRSTANKPGGESDKNASSTVEVESIKSSTTDSKGRRLSHYMAPTIASTRRRSQIGIQANKESK